MYSLIRQGVKIITFGCIIAISIVFVSMNVVSAGDYEDSSCRSQMFKVTAYYSPLPSQTLYYKPTYEQEIRLNGHGTNGASGAPVFNGMIAAPRSYAFGTKIRFPGWGVGQVEDRGQAIVHQGERSQPYDRIDIWVGRGEEGLRRALSFGVQYIEGFICGKEIAEPVGFDFDAFPYYEDFFNRVLRSVSLQPGRSDLFVTSLQRYLSALGFLDETSQTGEYSRVTKAAVCMFQQKHLGLSPSHQACGWFGPETRTTMRNLVAKKGITLGNIETLFEDSHGGNYNVSQNNGLEGESTVLEAIANNTSNKVADKVMNNQNLPSYNFYKPFIKGTRDKEVLILQKKLAGLGYYDQGSFTGVYDTATIRAVYRFQRAQGILNGDEPIALHGRFGPSTRSSLNRL